MVRDFLKFFHSPDETPCTDNSITCLRDGECVNEVYKNGSVVPKCKCINQYGGPRCEIGKNFVLLCHIFKHHHSVADPGGGGAKGPWHPLDFLRVKNNLRHLLELNEISFPNFLLRFIQYIDNLLIFIVKFKIFFNIFQLMQIKI